MCTTNQNKMWSTILTTLLLVSLHQAVALRFEQGDPSVQFDDSLGNIVLRMDENNDIGVRLITILEATSTPEITFVTSNEQALNAELVPDDSETGTYYITANNQVDYEMPDQKRFSFSVKDDVTSPPIIITLNINNLDDTPPVFTGGSCSMDENTTITFDNGCLYHIHDDDGFLDKMDFSNIINSNGGNEDQLFVFEYKDPPGTNDYDADVYLILQDGKVLDYETTVLYVFHVAVVDSGNNPTTPSETQIIVEVNDIPDEPPRWITFPPTQSIQEKKETTVEISARDGDFGINNPISYKVTDENGFAEIKDKTKGVITIHEIDRDAGFDVVVLYVTAYEDPASEWNITDTITLMIQDIDDHIPEITLADDSPDKFINVSIEENDDSPIDPSLIVTDIDLGNNAMFNVFLQKADDAHNDMDFTVAYRIIPNRGYQNDTFQINVKDVSYLDYEKPDWRVISFMVQSIEQYNESSYDSLPVHVYLIDINDESPIFDPPEYSTSVKETIEKGEDIGVNIKATDLDEEDWDRVWHSFVSDTANRILEIEELGGKVTTKENGVFDYEKQPEVVVFVQAKDNADPPHIATAQLTITVIDVNDEPPRIQVKSYPSVEENQPDGTVIPVDISASDPDTTASLEFSINWNDSYAAKNSRHLPPVECIAVKTIPDTDGDYRQVSVELSIIELEKNNTPDYETFDSLFIVLVVTDKNQEVGVGTDTATIAITIININDNPPEFTKESIAAYRSVIEYADVGTSIPAVTADDVDNLEPLEYSMENTGDTPPDWIEIDKDTAYLSVIYTNISCDDPVIYNLTYTVSVTDTEFVATLDIQIYIIDQNNKAPEIHNADDFSIPEDNGLTPDVTQNGDCILTFDLTDKDRDEPYHTVRCEFSSSVISKDVTNRFQIDDNQLFVNLNGVTLDREDVAEFDIILRCYDNPNREGTSQQNQIDATFIITLIDINDNIPIVVPGDTIVISESVKGGTDLTTSLQGKDDDEGKNGTISFEVVRSERYSDEERTNKIDEQTDLFTIQESNIDLTNKRAVITVNKDLEGLFGYFILIVKTTDHADDPLSQDNDVYLDVTKYNFQVPSITNLDDGETYYLSPIQTPNTVLRQWNNDPFDEVKATDHQEDKYDIRFSVAEEDGETTFAIANLGSSTGQLRLAADGNFDADKLYTVRITADINSATVGDQSHTTEITIYLKAFDENSDPVFNQHNFSVSFDEEQAGQTTTIPSASYPDINIPNLNTYYFLLDNLGLFSVDINDGNLTLVESVDYDTMEIKYFDLTVQATNSENGKSDVAEDSKLYIRVTINDINDNLPKFDKDNYFGTITTNSDRSGNTVLTAVATDVDTMDQGHLVYSIDYDTMDTSNVEGFPTNTPQPFRISSSTGQITLNFNVQENIAGYFVFEITVVDTDPTHVTRATVKIYIVTRDNTINFKFENSLETVINKSTRIQEILDDQFGVTSTVENPSADTSASANTEVTLTPVYFINNTANVPLLTTDVLKQLTDLSVYTQLRTTFLEDQLVLLSFDSQQPSENLEEILKAWLIGVSVVLGSLLVILLIVAILKIRSLSQRIKNLSNTKFGSQESGLNRQGIAAPTTNKHAVEGSNPVYNNEIDTKEIDQQSIGSGDSDLIGVEDNPAFEDEYPVKEKYID